MRSVARARRHSSVRYYRDGRRFEESSESEKYGDAVDLLKKREGEIVRGVPVSPKITRYRFEDAVADIEAEYVANGRRSLDHLQRRIRKHLNPLFARRRMSHITTSDVRAFTQKRLQAGASAGEINRELAILGRMFTLAVKAGRLLVKPDIPKLAEHNVRTGFFEAEQFEAVRAQLPAPLRAVLSFAYWTGWRVPSEIPHDFRTAVRNLERAGVSRSVAMQLTGHMTESVYRRYAIVSESDLAAGVEKLPAGTTAGTIGQKGRVRRFRRPP